MGRWRVLLLVILAAGCGWVPADEQVLTTFFEQSRLYDTTRVAGVATVVFDPRVEGVVERFQVTGRVDHPLDSHRLQRQTTLATHVRTNGGELGQLTSGDFELGVPGAERLLPDGVEAHHELGVVVQRFHAQDGAHPENRMPDTQPRLHA